MRGVVAKLGLALAGVLAALLVAEGLVRLLDIGPTFQVVHREVFRLSEDPLLGYELRPLAPDGPSRINSAGFRDREFPAEKPSGVFRIVALGDSVTFGQPREPEQSYPKHLERLLNACAQDLCFEVLNLGVTGYNALQVAERLRVLGLRYHPDLVLYGYVLNDPQELSIEREALLDLRAAEEQRFHESLRRGLLRRLSSSRLFLLARWTAWNEESADPLRPRFRHRVDPGYEALQAGDSRGQYFRELHEDPEGRARLRQGLDRLAEAARAAGVPVLVALFPLFLETSPYPLADVHELVGGEARARGFDVLDLAPVFRSAAAGIEALAVDFLHPGDRGCRVAALAVVEHLRSAGCLPADALGPWPRSGLDELERRALDLLKAEPAGER